MTPKSLSISSKYLRWLLPAGLLVILVLGFLQTPEVQTHVNPDFIWKDQIFRMHVEAWKAKNNLRWLTTTLDKLKTGERPGGGKLRQIKRTRNSVTLNLHFLDAMSANLTKELQAGLLRAAPARRAQLLAYLQQVKILQLHCQEYHRRLQEASRKVHQL